MIGGELPSRIANQGSTHQAPEFASDDTAEPMLVMA
jgi:hypothetical protein